MIFCISVVVTFRLPFLILLIWALSLFFLVSLAKGLSILFIFSKNQILVWSFLLFSSFLFHLFLLWSLWFLTFYLGFVCSSFSGCFRCKVRLFEIFLVSWGKIVLLYISLLALLLLHPVGFGSSCFRCHLSLGIFWFPLWFLQLSIDYLVTYCLASMCLCFLQFFFL